MSQESVEVVERGYALLNDAYRTGEIAGDNLPFEMLCHSDVTLQTSGMFPESGEYHGFDGLRQFTENQAEAFESMSAEPIEFIAAGNRVVVPIRVGGKARHTGIETTFSVVHVWTIRDHKVARIDMYRSRAEALKAVGLI
jgi:ketosteroid isomerase-like protein